MSATVDDSINTEHLAQPWPVTAFYEDVEFVKRPSSPPPDNAAPAPVA